MAMPSLDRPKLRQLFVRRVEHQGQPYVALEDPLGLVPSPVLVPLGTYVTVVRHLDGSRTLDELKSLMMSETGQALPPVELEALIAKLDEMMVLDGPTFARFVLDDRRRQIREPLFAGRSYPADRRALLDLIQKFQADPRGAGVPSTDRPVEEARVRGILSPHIDFGRGGPIYTHAYRSLVEGSDADVFVILGVAHQSCRQRFVMTRKDFRTPLGACPTDQRYVDLLVDRVGDHYFEDELVHRPEHSIEFQVVFLQSVLGDSRPYTIVPILVGSFHDLMAGAGDPWGDPSVRTMVEALRAVEVASGQKVAYIGGIDLCHVGPEFGDPQPIDTRTLALVETFDRKMLEHAAAGDAMGWFGEAAAIQNRWRVCGLAATYTMLQVMTPTRGRLLGYDQAVDASKTCGVTFASVAFETPRGAADGPLA